MQTANTLAASSASSRSQLAGLEELRRFGGARRTRGLEDDAIVQFLALDDRLGEAIDAAVVGHRAARVEHADLLRLSEADLVAALQRDLVNFYAPDTVNPYVPMAARGPWLVTAHGAVIHDSGGYGMLGFGHAPPDVVDALSEPYPMANVMTASLSQRRFTEALRHEIGHRRGGCPFERFIAMNSGSESVTVALRIADLRTKRLTEPGARHAGRTPRFLALQGSFHGRTEGPAQVSASTRPKYEAHLHSFHGLTNLVTVPVNDVAALEEAFAQADREGVFLQAMLMEPVMGEGRPGQAVSRAFYDAARRLTSAHGSLLIVDSIQAGLRAHGVLSIVDYPGFEDAEVPDIESYSKALNAGQFPLSVLACSRLAADSYVRGVYGNTMTSNARALEVACAVLRRVDARLRANIVTRGIEFLDRLRELKAEFPELVEEVRGTGLLLAMRLAAHVPAAGADSLEEWCRTRGFGVIHGGNNALRFTPHFEVGSAELDWMTSVLRAALADFRGRSALR